MEILYIQGLWIGLKSIVFWIIIGYFLTDIQIAVAHFEIDNFMPDDNGYKHHLTVAKYGFKYEKLSGQHQFSINHHPNTTKVNEEQPKMFDSSYTMELSVKFDLDTSNTELKNYVQVPCSPCAPCGPCCAPGTPGCSPCCPCSPAKKALDIYQILNTMENTIHRRTDSQMIGKDEIDHPLQVPCVPSGPCCSPGGLGCKPCCPCGPISRQNRFLSLLIWISNMFAFPIKLFQPNINSSDSDAVLISLWSFLICLTPLACFYICLPTGICLMFPIFNILNIISGSGSPDYYAHHSEKAPKYVKLAQPFHLMMTPNDHEKHHRNPRTGYAYFSPITNILLDHSGFWSIVKVAMEWQKGMRAVPVPIPLVD